MKRKVFYSIVCLSSVLCPLSSVFAQNGGTFLFQGARGQVTGGAFTAPAASAINKGYFQPFWLKASSIQATANQTGTTNSTLTYLDRLYNVSTANLVNDYQWVYASEADRPGHPTINRSSSDTSVVAPDSANPFHWQSQNPGTATLTLSHFYGQTETATVTVVASTPIRVLANFLAGSVSAHIASTLDGALAGKNPSTALAMFSTYSPPNTFVRNAGFWGASFDLTGVSAYNSAAGNNGTFCGSGTLVSPRHALYVNHCALQPGSTSIFVKSDGTAVPRTILATAPAASDIGVALLDSNVPSGITFAKVLPSNWYSKMPVPSPTAEGYCLPTPGNPHAEASSYPWPVPAMRLNQQRQGMVGDIYEIARSMPIPGCNQVICAQPVNATRRSFYSDIIVGDSGYPCLTIVNGQTVLLCHWTWGLVGSGDNLADFATQINAAMHTLSVNAGLGSDYQLTPVDLSSFNSY